MTLRRWLAWMVAVLAALHPEVARAAQAGFDVARFLTVNQGDDEFKSDQHLATVLAGLVETPLKLSYNQIVKDVVTDERDSGTVARLTPYAFVVSEMLGARLDLIATYSSRSTKSTTYNAYLVVSRDFVAAAQGREPTLSQIVNELRARSHPKTSAKFVYHSQLSTSSYFLPSLYFRAQRIFADTGSASPGVTTIRVQAAPSDSSSELVKMVAGGQADIASVWDGTRAKFIDNTRPEFAAYGEHVWFVRLPSDLPCDLLVATSKVDRAVREGIRERLAKHDASTGASAATPGDVAAWVPWSDGSAEGARTALSILRRQAVAPPAPVVVEVRTTRDAAVAESELEAVRQAIRLSGTEFVSRREYFDYFQQYDVEWVLRRIHDGAVRLTVEYSHFLIDDRSVTQSFDVSFVEPDDLTRRIAALIHSRMHRIRQVWLYTDRDPTIIRDVEFDIAPGTSLPVQVIEWNDPERNVFDLSTADTVRVHGSDFHSLSLEKSSVFPMRTGDPTALDFEPMGRKSWRVLLMRADDERPLFRALTVALVALFVLAAVGLAWDLRRTNGHWIPRGSAAKRAAGEASERAPAAVGREQPAERT